MGCDQVRGRIVAVLGDYVHRIFNYTLENEEQTKQVDVGANFIRDNIDSIINAHIDANNAIVTDAPYIYVGTDYTLKINSVVSGYNDLYTWCMKNGRADIIRAFNAADNSLSIHNIACRSYRTIVNLKCDKCGTVEEHRPSTFATKQNLCLVCAAKEGKAKQLVAGVNDLKTWCEQNNRLDILLDYSDKNSIKTCGITQKSHTKVIWECHNKLTDTTICGHTWTTSLSDRTSANNGCPVCAARNGRATQLIKGVNDLKSWCIKNNRQDILNNWVDIGVPAQCVSYKNDTVRVKISCSVCHKDIVTYPYLLTNSDMSTVCKQCRASGTSVPQIIVYKMLLKEFSGTKYRELIQCNEADIFIPELSLAIEYNGVWHLTREGVDRDLKKLAFFKSIGITVLTVQEYPTVQFTALRADDSIINICYKSNRSIDLYKTITDWINKRYRRNADIAQKELIRLIEEANQVMARKRVPNSLVDTHPDIAKDWDHSLNGALKPDGVTYGSQKMVHWVCRRFKEPHSYEMSVKKRCEGQKCPCYSGKKVIKGKNDLMTLAPTFMRNCWDLDANKENGVNYASLTANSHKTVYLHCPFCGHRWTRIASTVLGNHLKAGTNPKCPQCKAKLYLK